MEVYLNGEIMLTSREKALDDYKKSCKKYANEMIYNACNKCRADVDLKKDYLYKDLIDELKADYKVLVETDNYLTISWADEQETI